MSLVTQSIVLLAAGVICLLAFAYLLLVLSPRWFPESDPSRVPTPRTPSGSGLGFALFGGLELAVLLAGIYLTTSGFFMVQLR